MASKENRSNKIKDKLLHKYRFVVLNEETFEERFSFKLNRLNGTPNLLLNDFGE